LGNQLRTNPWNERPNAETEIGFSVYRLDGRYIVRTQLANENPMSRSRGKLKPRWRKFDIAALGLVTGRLG